MTYPERKDILDESSETWYDIYTQDNTGCYRIPPTEYDRLIDAIEAARERFYTIEDVYGFDVCLFFSQITSIRLNTPEARARWNELHPEVEEF
jgi:hypothetical protein